MYRLATLIAIVVMGIAPAWCHAAIIELQTFINSSQEVSVTTGLLDDTLSEAIGVGLFEFDTDTKELSWTMVHTQSLLDGEEISTGLFGPALAGENGGLLHSLSLGVLKTGSFDVSILTASDEDDLLADKWYVNIKTVDHPNGEIRGQLVVASTTGTGANNVIPEPTTLILLGIGAGATSLTRRRRHVLVR